MTRTPTVHEVMRDRLLAAAGVPRYPGMGLAAINRAQWSHEFCAAMVAEAMTMGACAGGAARFVRLMRRRLVLGGMRYGLSDDPDKRHYDCAALAADRLHIYNRTGDLEMLVDVANMYLLTYVERRTDPDLPARAARAMAVFTRALHPKAHFGSNGEAVAKAVPMHR